MGVYSEILAPWGVGFWFVAFIGALFTVVPLLAIFFGDNCDKRSRISLGAFSAIATLVLIHCFGDSRVLGWLYEAPDRGDPTGWATLIIPFGPVFWLLVATEGIVAFCAIRRHSGVAATISLLATLLLVQFVTGVPVFPWIIHNKVVSALLLGGYIVVGSLWSFFYKWDRLVCNHRARYDEVRATWLKTKDFTEQSDFTLQDKADWEEYFSRNSYDFDENQKIEARPKYRLHKSELLGWAMLWPMSVFETFLFDWLADVFARIYKQLGGVLEWIMIRRWKGTEDHMLTDEEREILEKEKHKK